MTGDLRRLALLAGMIDDAERARLSRLAARRREAENAMSSLRAQQARVLRAAGPDAAHRAGADIAWFARSERHMASLAAEGARAASETEAQLATARRAAGRAQVLRDLVSRLNRTR